MECILEHQSLEKMVVQWGIRQSIKNKPIKLIIINFIELFFLKKYKLSNTNIPLLNFYHYFLKKIYNTEKFNLDEESLFLEFKSKLLNG